VTKINYFKFILGQSATETETEIETEIEIETETEIEIETETEIEIAVEIDSESESEKRKPQKSRRESFNKVNPSSDGSLKSGIHLERETCERDLC
jgi:hypothetical protein